MGRFAALRFFQDTLPPPLRLVLGLRPCLGAVAAACEFAAPSHLPCYSLLSLEQVNLSRKSGHGYPRRDSLAEVGQDLNRVGFFAVVGCWGRGAAARRRRAAARPARSGAHVRRGGAREPWPPSRTRQSLVEWAGRLGGQPRAAMGRPTPAGLLGPLGTSCVRGKMAALRPCCRELKMEDAAARESGRVSHPHKGKGPFPLRPPLPVTPRCTRRRPGTSISSQRLGSGPSSRGRGFRAVELTPRLVGGDESWASLALVIILLGICPLRVWILAYSPVSGAVV